MGMGWIPITDAINIVHPISSRYPVIVPLLFHPLLPCCSVRLALKFSFTQCRAKNAKDSCKSWRGQIHLVPIISKVGGNASHGSHKAVAPVYLCSVYARMFLAHLA